MERIAYIITALSLIGTVANSLQKRWCFYIWICTNAFWVVYNAIIGSYSQMILYLFNFAMAIIGVWKWKKEN